MAKQELNDVISYLETKLATNSDLAGNIHYTDEQSSIPVIKRYGVHLYVEGEPFETEHKYLGPMLTEMWTIKTDIILNRRYVTDRKSVSDAKGISYWIATVKALLLNGTNSGAFESSEWNYLTTDETGDTYILKGEFLAEINNVYT